MLLPYYNGGTYVQLHPSTLRTEACRQFPVTQRTPLAERHEPVDGLTASPMVKRPVISSVRPRRDAQPIISQGIQGGEGGGPPSLGLRQFNFSLVGRIFGTP